MKNIRFLFNLLILNVICNSFAAEIDISTQITNSGFEDDLTAWTVQNGSDGTNTITPASATDQKHSGSKSVKFPLNYGNQLTTEARVYQTINGLTPGDYILKAYVRGKRWEKDNGIFADGGSGDVKEATDFNSPSNISDQWNLVSVAFTVDNSGTAVVGGYASKRRSASDRTNDFWIDDFQLFRIEENSGGDDPDCDVTIQQKNLVTRDNNANGFGADLFTSSGTDGGSSMEADQDNPDKTGINTTSKCLLNKGSGVNWHHYGKISGNAVSVDNTYRYLHVMLKAGKAGDSGHEYTNSGDAMLLIRTGSSDTPSDYQGNNKATDIRIALTTEWTEHVFDLQTLNISQVQGFYFGDQNWTDNHQREIYWDQIVLNNKPCATDNIDPGNGDDPGNGAAGTLADFDGNGSFDSYAVDWSDNMTSTVVANPWTTCLNTSANSLHIKTTTADKWYERALLKNSSNTSVAITSENKYLHVLIYSATDDKVIFRFQKTADQSFDNIGDNGNNAYTITKGAWQDLVIDLSTATGGAVTNLYGIFLAGHWDSDDDGFEYYVDEIILNNSSTPRTDPNCTPADNNVTINATTQYQTIDGFGASDCWMGNFVGKWTGNNKATVAKWLFSQNFDSTGNPEGIGLSIWRFNLGAGTYELSPNGDSNTNGSNVGDNVDSRVARRAESFLANVNTAGTYNWNKCAGQQYFLQQAKNYGCESFVAFSNSPVIPFTKNNQGYSGSSSNANITSNGYSGFADYMVDVVKHFKDAGYNFTEISPINEPQWNWNTKEQEGSPWTNSEIKTLVTALNNSITTKALNNTKIMITEAGKYNFLYSNPNNSNNPNAGNQIETFFNSTSENYVGNLTHVAQAIAGHSYWLDKSNSEIKSVRQSVKSAADTRGLKVHQTEWSMMETDGVDGFPSNWDYIDVALNMAKLIHSDLAYADAVSWSYWTAMYMEQWSQKNRFWLVHVKPNDDEYANTHTQLETEGPVETKSNLWALGNYSLFVRPGYKRIALTGADNLAGLMGTAYIAPDNSRIVAVYVNMANEAKTVQTALSGLPSGYEATTNKAYLTDASNDLKKMTLDSDTYDSNKAISIPGRSVVTVVYSLAPAGQTQEEWEPNIPFAEAWGECDFETVAPQYEIEDEALSTLAVQDNPYKVLNHTSKVLYGKVSDSKSSSWGGARISFDPTLTVSDENRYLHLLVRTSLSYFELVPFPEKWAGKFYSPSTTDWFDCVLDLKHGSLDCSALESLRIVVYSNDNAHGNKEIWIDEIVANNDPNPRTHLTIAADASVASTVFQYQEKENNKTADAYQKIVYNDVLFQSDDTGTGQITGIAAEGFSPLGTVQLKKTVTKQWYPIGLPFELDGVYADLLNIDFGAQLAARYAFDGDLKNEAGVAFEGFAEKRGTGSVPALVDNSDRPGKSAANQVLQQSSGTAQNESLTRFTNPLQGISTASGFTVSLWVNWTGSNGDGCIAAFSDPNFGRLFVTPNSGLAYKSAAGDNGFSFSNFTSLTSNTWTLLTLTFTNNGLALYVDGAKVNESPSWTGNADYSSLLTFISTVPYFYLGYGSGKGSAPLSADNLLFYKKALNDDEVSRLYNLYVNVYKEYTVGKYGIELTAYDKTEDDGDFWLQKYVDGYDNFEYISLDEMEAGKGYVIQFPTYFNNKEITFVSKNNVVLKNTSSSNVLNNSFSGYALVANPSVAAITTLNEIADAANGAYYVYNQETHNFGLIKGSDVFSLKPFESLGIALAYEGPLRSSLGQGGITRWDIVSGNDPVVQVRYYNLQGIEIARPADSGIYIEKRIHASQKIEVHKLCFNK